METATALYNVSACSFRFSLEPQLEAGIPAVFLGILCHGCHSFLPAHNDQQFPGPGDGRVENAPGQRIGRTVPGGEDHGPVL